MDKNDQNNFLQESMTAVMEKQWQEMKNKKIDKNTFSKQMLKYLEINHPEVFEEFVDQYLLALMLETQYEKKEIISYAHLKKEHISSKEFLLKYDC